MATTSTLPLNSYGLCNYSLCSYGRQINLAEALARLRGPLRARQPEEEKDDDEEAPAAEAQRPFFFAVGLHKPHMPWSVPKRFFDMQPPVSQVALPAHPFPPSGMPPVAFNPTGNCTQTLVMPDEYMRAARRAYMAAISYMDHNVGQLLSALEASGRANGTLVIFHADHGCVVHGSRWVDRHVRMRVGS